MVLVVEVNGMKSESGPFQLKLQDSLHLLKKVSLIVTAYGLPYKYEFWHYCKWLTKSMRADQDCIWLCSTKNKTINTSESWLAQFVQHGKNFICQQNCWSQSGSHQCPSGVMTRSKFNVPEVIRLLQNWEWGHVLCGQQSESTRRRVQGKTEKTYSPWSTICVQPIRRCSCVSSWACWAENLTVEQWQLFYCHSCWQITQTLMPVSMVV